MDEIVRNVLETDADRVYADLLERSDGHLTSERSKRNAFEERLRETWGQGIDALELLYLCVVETGHRLASEMGKKSEEQVPQASLLLGTHARACQITSEIIILLKSGHAEGALGRWRSLYETTIVLSALAEGGAVAARYFKERGVLLNAKMEKAYSRYRERAGLAPLEQEVSNEVKHEAAKVIRSSGKRVRSDWGWAISLLTEKGVSFGGTPGIIHVAEAVGLDHLHPYYLYSNNLVHMSIATLIQNSRASEGRWLLPTGGSNDGLDLPGQLTAISLYQASATLINSFQRDIESVRKHLVLKRFSDAAKEAFVDIDD